MPRKDTDNITKFGLAWNSQASFNKHYKTALIECNFNLI